MPRPRKPLAMLAPSAFKKNAKRNLEAGRSLTEPDFPELDLMVPPEDLTPAAAVIWKEFSPHLAGIVRVTDCPLLVQLCELYAELKEDLETVRREGRTQVHPTIGHLQNHPLLSRISDARRHIVAISSQFGLSPVARAKVGAPEKEPEKNVFSDI